VKDQEAWDLAQKALDLANRALEVATTGLQKRVRALEGEPLPPLREQHSSVGSEGAVEQGRVYSLALDSTKPETFLEAKLAAMGQQIEHFKTQLANAEKALADEQMRQGGVLGSASISWR